MSTSEPSTHAAQAASAPDDLESSAPVPDHAHVVLVPLANPETATDLLRIANAVVRADGGRVVGLSVAVGDADAEQAVERMEELEELAADVVDGIEVLRRTAGTVARGILDAAREVGADLMVLGLSHAEGGEVELGIVIQSVVQAATCDVLLYRPGRAVTDLDHLDRVIVGVDDSPAARAAARIGLLLADGFERPIDALTVAEGGQPKGEAWGLQDRVLSGVTDQERCRRRVVKNATAAAGLTTAANGDDLLVIGFEQHSSLDEWLGANVVRKVLDRASGPTIAVSRNPSATVAERRARNVLDWLRPRMTAVERETVDWRSQAQAKTSLDYMTLIVVSVVLASLGLLLNSAAVIIGAMLVAPLMGPLVAFAIALRVARMQIVRQSLLTILVGTLTAFGVSVLIGWVVPLDAPTPEMLGRGSPTLLDAGVALASGLVGAYATARKDIPAALAGVAIAAALVPPICVSGLAVGLADLDLAIGAGLLFTVNVVCIAAIATGVFAWLGMEPSADASPGHQHVAVIGALLLPLVIGALLVLGASRFDVPEQAVRNALEDTMPGLELVEVEVVDADPQQVVVTVRGPEAPAPEQVASLRERLRVALRTPALDLRVAHVLLVGAD